LLRVLVTGAGGVGGINFVRTLKAAPEDVFVVGTDYNEYYLMLSPVDKGYRSPKHSDPAFLKLIREIVDKENIEFIHPQPEVELEVLSYYKEKIRARTLIPPPEVVRVARDKYSTCIQLKNSGLDVPDTRLYSREAVEELSKEYGWPLWLRARRGAGGRLSLPIYSVEEAEYWVKLWSLRGIDIEEFIVQEYLPGRDIAWDSLWFRGELYASFTRERLHYIFPNLSPSRITGTPTVARIVRDERVDKLGIEVVKSLDPNASGFYCLDLKYDADGIPKVTEVNVKAHTTLSLWSYAIIKAFNFDWKYNIPYVYVKSGIEDQLVSKPLGTNIFPENIMLIRHLDAGVLLVDSNGKKVGIL